MGVEKQNLAGRKAGASSRTRRTRKMKKVSGTPRAKTAKILNSTSIYEGPVFGLRRDEGIEPSGGRAIREVITHPGSVAGVPLLADGRIPPIRKYPRATRQDFWAGVA